MADEKRSSFEVEVPDLALPDVGPAPAVRAAAKAPAAKPLPRAVPDDDDDGLGMEIERDVSRPFEGPASTSRPTTRGAGMELDGPARPRPASSGLEVTYRRLDPRSVQGDDGPSRLPAVLGPIAAVVASAGSFAALVRTVHRPAGIELTRIAPHAFDGTSVVGSAVVALTAFVLAMATGYAGVRSSSRSWLLVATATATMLLALAMVTIILASSGEHGPPPDGALLVPFLAPFALATAGVDLVVRAARRFMRAHGARKLGGVPLAAIAGGLLFVAFEASRLASLLPRWR